MTRFTVIAIRLEGVVCRDRVVEVVYLVCARIELSLLSMRYRGVDPYSVVSSHQ